MDIDTELFSLREENAGLKRENAVLKASLEKDREWIASLECELQSLRLALYGLKPSRKKHEEKEEKKSESPPKKLGPPAGHAGVSRKKPERVDATIVLDVDACPFCNGAVSGLEHMRERFVEDFVPAQFFVTRYVLKQAYCQHCRRVVSREIPCLVDGGHFGPRFSRYVSYLRYSANLPENKIAMLLNEVHHANVSEGTIVNYLRRAAKKFGVDYEQIKTGTRENNNHYDDTGQRVCGENRWLWTFASRQSVLYHTCNSRSKKVVSEILGEDYGGVTIQDFYPSYDKAVGIQQKCWSHLLTDARTMVERKKPPPQAQRFHERLQKIFHDAKETEKRLTEEQRKKAYHRFVRRLGRFASESWKHPDLKRLAKRVKKYRHKLCTFLRIQGVEPTNNRAERALRQCVVQRKIWGGFRTEQGAKDRDVMMSVIETMKLQGKNILKDGTECISTQPT